MTMSIHQSDVSDLQEKDNVSELKGNEVTSLPTKSSIKRSFDVAFLISQDDKTKQKQIRNHKHNALLHSLAFHSPDVKNYSDNSNSTVEDVRNSPETKVPYHKFIQKPYEKSPSPNLHEIHRNTMLLPEIMRYQNQHKYINSSHSPPKVFDDPRGAHHFQDRNMQEQKSAFTKVNLTPKMESRVVSPNHSISPELNYQNSLSPSPPILNTYVQKTFQNLIPHSANPTLFKNSLPTYSNAFMEQNFAGTSTDHAFTPKSVMEQQMLFKNQNEIFAPKLRQSVLNYRPELPHYAYPAIGAFQTAPEMVKFAPAPSAQDIMKLQTNPAAAILNSLLPPTFAALSLPAQNVCAKCNISFRMTSDLVYHMRSHHKSDMSNEHLKKRREDKLKCPVCSESFRERHHLTRHMTAHQDKEGDVIDDPTAPPNPAGANGALGAPGRKVRTMGNATAAYNNVYCK